MTIFWIVVYVWPYLIFSPERFKFLVSRPPWRSIFFVLSLHKILFTLRPCHHTNTTTTNAELQQFDSYKRETNLLSVVPQVFVRSVLAVATCLDQRRRWRHHQQRSEQCHFIHVVVQQVLVELTRSAMMPQFANQGDCWHRANIARLPHLCALRNILTAAAPIECCQGMMLTVA